MYECAVCQRTYKTQTSLTRHARNHTEELSSGHSCDMCGTGFARRDLLTRHQQSAHGDNLQQRKRCHTACEACRELRIRCDGADPCRSCVAASKDCRYSQQGRRVSKPGRTQSQRAADTDEHIEPFSGVTPQASNTSDLPDGIYANTHDDSGFLPEPFSAITDPTYEWPAIDLDGLSWPWVHETLFLHGDPSVVGSSSTVPDNGRNIADPLELIRTSGDQGPSTPDLSSILSNEIELLVGYATDAAVDTGHRIDHSEYWRSAAIRLLPILGEFELASNDTGEQRARNQPTHILHRAILGQYLPKFNRLWPMFLEANFQPDCLNPILYLVLVSIGSMYGSSTQKQFGMALHKSLRRLLVGSLFELENVEGNQIWMAQARLLTQVQGLYFGQPHGFSYAQHLGAILVAQARRLELFQQPAPPRQRPVYHPEWPASGSDKLDIWLQSETRNRLAFGILRADVFTSVLLNSRPLLSFEEIDLFTPCSDDLWRDMEGLSVSERLIAIRIEERPYASNLFSDLVRLLLDREENLPAMRSISHELCLFGLQASIWKVSHDPKLFQRLTGGKYVRHPQSSSRNTERHFEPGGGHGDAGRTHENYGAVTMPSNPSEQPAHTHDLLKDAYNASADVLAGTLRRMHDMQSDRDRVEDALEKWHHGLQSVRAPQLAQHRDTLMSSLLLWHMSYLRLYAPLHQLHDISYRTGERQGVTSDSSEQVRAWTEEKEASLAASRALKICDLIHLELERPLESRASFNFLAFGSLHHAAVALWTISEVKDDFTFLGADKHSSLFGKMLSHKNTTGLLKACARLFRMLSPMGGKSFSLAADRLSQVQFPTKHETVSLS